MSVYNLERKLDLAARLSITNRLKEERQTDLVGYRSLLYYAWMKLSGMDKVENFILQISFRAITDNIISL